MIQVKVAAVPIFIIPSPTLNDDIPAGGIILVHCVARHRMLPQNIISTVLKRTNCVEVGIGTLDRAASKGAGGTGLVL